MSNAPDEPTEAENDILESVHFLCRYKHLRLLRAHVAAEVAKATAELLKTCEQWEFQAKDWRVIAANARADNETSCAQEAIERAEVFECCAQQLRRELTARAQKKDT